MSTITDVFPRRSTSVFIYFLRLLYLKNGVMNSVSDKKRVSHLLLFRDVFPGHGAALAFETYETSGHNKAPITYSINYRSTGVRKSKGVAMAQVVSRRPLTAEAQVRARFNPRGICGGQSVTGTGYSPSSSVFLCQYISHRRSPNSYHLGNA
jgi:hypothetical protein